MAEIHSSASEERVQVLKYERRALRRSLPAAFLDHPTAPQGGEGESILDLRLLLADFQSQGNEMDKMGLSWQSNGKSETVVPTSL